MLVLEQEAVGGVIGKVSTVTHYAGILESETGRSFAARLKRQTEKSGVELVYERVTGVRLKGEVKKIFTEGHVYEAGRVILANGTTPNRLNIPGEEELTGLGMNMNAARDGEQYRGRHVYVVGGADGAVKEAIYLSGLAEKVTVLHFEETLGAISEFQQKVKAAGNIEVKLHTRLTAVAGKGRIEKLELTDVRDGSTFWREDPGCGIFVYAGLLPIRSCIRSWSWRRDTSRSMTRWKRSCPVYTPWEISGSSRCVRPPRPWQTEPLLQSMRRFSECRPKRAPIMSCWPEISRRRSKL